MGNLRQKIQAWFTSSIKVLQHSHKRLLVLCAIAVGFMLISTIAKPFFYINISMSNPLGIYYKYPPWIAIKVGDYVIFPKTSITENRTKDFSAMPNTLVKIVFATEGEIFQDKEGNLVVNKMQFTIPKRLEAIRTKRIDIKAGEAFLIGQNSSGLTSYDSRFYGPLPVSKLRKAKLIMHF